MSNINRFNAYKRDNIHVLFATTTTISARFNFMYHVLWDLSGNIFKMLAEQVFKLYITNTNILSFYIYVHCTCTFPINNNNNSNNN